ncbi:TetR/AcrR family transcriptional regulator [Sphingomonas bacterium]|uniref:TetR/AcrR family transcriptional regulator n=1 Tax=Sphingomonas bacterium TaxID=1895847 RepID=UPI0020C6B517|nr:TetR/AcrR family transcriptional regulator [Sphingomonas bacterium]
MDETNLCCGMMRDRAGLRRQRIIDAARTLFVCNGFHATGVAQIAKASGVAVGQIYRDFAAKEDIVAAIVEGDCARLLERDSLQRAIQASDTDSVWHWIGQFVRPTTGREAVVMLAEITAESTRNERIAAIFARTRADVWVNILAALALLMPGDRAAGRRELLAELALTQSLGLRQQLLLQPDMDVERLADAIIAVIMREVEAVNAVTAAGSDTGIGGETRAPNG